MSRTTDVDIIVGGGGVAGLAAAAAVQQLGYHVMVVEPGQHDDRRLAGEIFHPPGVAGLAELGLLPALTPSPAVNVSGFYVTSERGRIRLPYDAVPAHRMPGLCIEHGLIRERLLNAIGTLPNVNVKQGARVARIDQSEPGKVTVDVADGRDTDRYRCRALVIADGSPSRLAHAAGIDVQHRRISTVWGYRIGTENLFDPEFGHVFLGGETPILFYPIGRNVARILFDIPFRSDHRPTAADCITLAQALPDGLRAEVIRAIQTQPRMSVQTRATCTAQSSRGGVVLVGDAGGSCHPLTATGMTMCVSDALMLRRALAERRDDLPAALKLYEERRRWPQATRLVLADALRDALCGATPTLRVVQGGILAMWRDSAAGRSATLALLSTADGRPFALLRQILVAMVRGFITHLRNPDLADRNIGALSMAGALATYLLRHLRNVARSTKPFV
jgi:2-polyprenyl-6-methoxyphenol hydroxylase-like FAD-dependent oxidoreductase